MDGSCDHLCCDCGDRDYFIDVQIRGMRSGDRTDRLVFGERGRDPHAIDQSDFQRPSFDWPEGLAAAVNQDPAPGIGVLTQRGRVLLQTSAYPPQGPVVDPRIAFRQTDVGLRQVGFYPVKIDWSIRTILKGRWSRLYERSVRPPLFVNLDLVPVRERFPAEPARTP